MAIPADVISGETIESEWGNTIRDFACFGIDFDGAMDAAGGAMTTTFATVCTVTFIRPADWVNYKLMAWGSAQIQDSVGSSSGEIRFQIDGANGTAGLYGTNIVQIHYWSASQTVTAETAASCVINLQVREVTGSGLVVGPSQINYIAVRTS